MAGANSAQPARIHHALRGFDQPEPRQSVECTLFGDLAVNGLHRFVRLTKTGGLGFTNVKIAAE